MLMSRFESRAVVYFLSQERYRNWFSRLYFETFFIMAQRYNSGTEAKLIDAVRDRPALWEKRHPDYMNQVKKCNYWTEVAALMDTDDVDAGTMYLL